MKKDAPKKSSDRRKIKPATLQNALQHKEERKASGKMYAESAGNKFDEALNKPSGLSAKVKEVETMTPEKRAEAGGMIGAHLGNRLGGPHGSLIGAAVGSDAARSFGVAASGENEIAARQAKVTEALQNLSIIDESGAIVFKDGTMLDVLDPDAEIPNTSPNISGKRTRGVYETDSTNPFTDRSKCVAMPIAYYLVGGLLKFDNFKEKATLKAIDNTSAMLINAFQNGATSIDAVYAKGQELVKKLGVKRPQMDEFFYAQRKSVSEKDAKEIKKGLNILFGTK